MNTGLNESIIRLDVGLAFRPPVEPQNDACYGEYENNYTSSPFLTVAVGLLGGCRRCFPGIDRR